MLSSAETVDVIAETLQAHRIPTIVLDPVLKTKFIYQRLGLTMLTGVPGYDLDKWV